MDNPNPNQPPPPANKNLTSSSFAEAAANKLPLSSHGPGHAPSLQRGMACLVCRTRKVKCDSQKPTCGACYKSAIAHGEDPSLIICNFDEPERGQKRKRGAGGQSKVQELESKIAELERIIAESTLGPRSNAGASTSGAVPPPNVPTTATYPVPPQPTNFASSAFSVDPNNPGAATSRNHFDLLLQAGDQTQLHHQQQQHQHQQQLAHPPSFPVGSQPGPDSYFSSIQSFVPSGAGAPPNFYNNPVPPSYLLPESPQERKLLDMLYPGWPRDLPTPALVNRLIEVYFQKSHAATGMINERKFLAAMRLPPSHVNFPHPCLLHAMLASASRMVSKDTFQHEAKYWGKMDENETVADYHAKRAKFHVDAAINGGVKLFQIHQAVVLLCFYSYTNARFVEVWLGCGLATRIATPLGLNHLRSANQTPDDKPVHVKPNLLPPTDDPEELYERSVTFWLTVQADRFASASTGWAMSLDETDITSLLPTPEGVYPENFDLSTSPLSIKNPNFLIAHPPYLVQGLQLFCKATILLGRVTTFLQRAPTPTGWKVGDRDDEPPIDLRTTPTFKRLDADAVTFRLSIPREYQAIHQSAPHQDNRLCLVFAIPHTATILLHEPFCTLQEGDVSMARCSLSAKAILEDVYRLWSTSFELGLLTPFINFSWAVAGRTLVRELAIKQSKGILAGQDQLIADVHMILSAMRAYKSPLGTSTAASLQSLLDKPFNCLPHMDLRTAGVFPPNTVEPCGYTDYSRQQPPQPSETNSSSGSSPYDMPATPNGGLDLQAMLFNGQLSAATPPPVHGFPDDGRFKEMPNVNQFDLDAMYQGTWQ